MCSYPAPKGLGPSAGPSYIFYERTTLWVSLLLTVLLNSQLKLIKMEHTAEPTRTLCQGEEVDAAKATRAETKTVADYFERYERRHEGKEGTEESNMDYWLSEEEEEESHQLRRQKWKSRAKREPYVVRDAKGPKLRPAEGSSMVWKPSRP